MARVTVEDCIEKVNNRFDLILMAAHRARMISSGQQITVDRDNDKNPVVALREIADGTLTPEDLEEDFIHSLQKHVEVDEPEAETVPALVSAEPSVDAGTGEETLAKLREIAVGVTRRRHALVDLEEVDIGPVAALVGECAQHLPRRAAAAHCELEATAPGDGGHRLGRDEARGSLRHRGAVGMDFELWRHRAAPTVTRQYVESSVTVGSSQPPGGVRRVASAGPQLPARYANSGVPAAITGSTIRHASST